MSPDVLRARVADAYDRLGLPSWAPPRAEGVEPRDEEYSRVSDLHKYRVVHGRAHAWTEVLGALPGVVVERLGPVTTERHEFARGVRIVSPVPGTLPLVLLEQDAGSTEHGEAPDFLHLAVQDPDHRIDHGVPDCGCDACDVGSAGLLEAIDDGVLSIVAGPFVLLVGKGWKATWYPDGGSMEGDTRAPSDFSTVMRACRSLADGGAPRLPRSSTALVGRSWLDAPA
ncbi:DUF6226 family protein [Isoptericola sp. NPDC060257]|uniref:DUF6226 family protein n=1 Tax=Isoptericola sp. NPDC060257 TaxID=3347087 RepID=UPI003653B12A